MPRFYVLLLSVALFLGACKSSEPGSTPSAAASTDSTPTATADSTPPAVPPSSDEVSLALDAPLPIDETVRMGQLENGLIYYIRPNTEPANRAELRLAINAGAILEDEDQLGLAHFLEHMLFNGTRRFEEQELVNFLERTGMRFGPDVNAYTSFDETVYMLTIPTDSTEIVERAFDVLEDWAAYATLDPEEIDKERGVVVEEWRARLQNAQGRIQEQQIPVLLHDSRYKDRLPIGDTTIIKNAAPETVRRFYEDWYRPDLMAVVAVGDIDVDRFEQLIQEHFSTLPEADDPRPRPSYDVPGHEETLYAIVADPEYPYSTVQVAYKKPADDFETVADYRERLISQMFNDMLNKRFDEIAQDPEAPFLGAGVSRGSIARTSAFTGVFAQVQDGEVATGLEAILTEAARVREHGFTATELEREQQEMLRSYQRAYNERENTNSSSYAREYVAHYLEGEPTPGIAYEYELVQRYVPAITLDDINALADDLLADESRVVLVTMPEKPDLTPPTEADLNAVLDAVQDKPIEPYEDEITDQPLIADVPMPAEVASRREIPEIEVTEFTLANGVRVVMKPTDFKEDEVQFTASSPGGSSLATEEDIVESEFVTSIITQSGVGPFTETQLQKALSGKVVSVSPFINELEEGLRGSASPEDLETLFQLIHLYFTEPRADSSALGVLQNQIIAYLANRSATPQAALQDTLTAILYDNHPRRRVPTIEEVQNLDLQDAFALYQDRFADASDFTFIFAGNVDVQQLTELAQTYLGTLPATGREETWRNVYPDLPEGTIERTVEKGIADRSTVQMIFHGPFDYTRENRHVLRSMSDVLSIKLREDLREERGGVYGVSVQPSTNDAPDSTYRVSISFTTDPARVDELIQAVIDQIETLTQNGPTADDLLKVKEQQRRQRETQKETNGFWVSVLDFYYSHPNEDVLDVLRYEDMIQALTAEEIQEAAQRYLDRDRFVRAVLNPEATSADE